MPIKQTKKAGWQQALGIAAAGATVWFLLVALMTTVLFPQFHLRLLYDWMGLFPLAAAVIAAIVADVLLWKRKKIISASALAAVLALLLAPALIWQMVVPCETTFISSFSPKGSHTVSFTRPPAEGAHPLVYKNVAGPTLLKLDEQLPSSASELRADWLSENVCAVTYIDNEEKPQAYLVDFHSNPTNCQLPALESDGSWRGGGYALQSDGVNLYLRSDNSVWTKVQFQEVTDSAGLLTAQDGQQWVLALADGRHGYGIARKDGLLLRAVTMDDTDTLTLSWDSSPDAQGLPEEPSSPESSAPESGASESGTSANDQIVYSNKGAPIGNIKVSTGETDPFAVFQAFIQQVPTAFSDNQCSHTMSQIQLTLQAGDSNAFVMQIDAGMTRSDSGNTWTLVRVYRAVNNGDGSYTFDKLEDNGGVVSPSELAGLTPSGETRPLDGSYKIPILPM